jgi:hypothetical protein
MKQIYSLLFLLLFTVAFGQAPANYYTTATGTGYTLKRNFTILSRSHSSGLRGPLHYLRNL